MSQAQELLNSLADQPAVSIANTNAEEHIVIGRDRVIVIPASLKRLGVQYDHNIETVTFDCPRFWDEHDLSQMEIYINYMLPNNTVGGDVAKNIAIVGDSISFDWTITNNVTQYKGSLAILVCAKKTDEDGNKINHWNSELNREAYISEGMDCGDVIAMEYPDIITELLTRMDVLENNAPSASPGSSGIYVGSEEPTDPNVELWVNPDDDEVQTFIKSPATASVGQTIVVKSVDENGKPTEWEAVDMPSGGEGNSSVIAPLHLLADVTSTEALNIFEVTLSKRAVKRVVMQITVPASGAIEGYCYGRLNGKMWDALIFGNGALPANANKWLELEFMEGDFAKYTASNSTGNMWAQNTVSTCGKLEMMSYVDSIGIQVASQGAVPAGTRLRVWGE